MGSMSTNSRPSNPLVNPTPTKVKREAAFTKRLKGAARRDGALEIPALDCAALSRKYGMERAYEPKMHEGTFVAPLGIKPDQYQRLRNDMIHRFLDAMDKQGWDFVADQRIQVYPGIYPARDLVSGLDLLDRREMVIRAHFQFRNPQPIRLELPPELVAAVPITA